MSEQLKKLQIDKRSKAAGLFLSVLLAGCSPEASHPTVPAKGTAASQPAFSPESSIREISPEQAALMKGVTLRDYPGCATADELRIVDVPYKNFDGANAMGALVVRRELASEVGDIFEEIYKTDFKIAQVVLPEASTSKRSNDPATGVAIDNELMEKNITSGFNCRTLDGKVDKHGLGRAIDINPLQNPMIEPNPFTSPHAAKFTYSPPAAEGTWETSRPDTLLTRQSKIGSKVITIFKQHGWRWGGDFKTIYDGQHFDKST